MEGFPYKEREDTHRDGPRGQTQHRPLLHAGTLPFTEEGVCLGARTPWSGHRQRTPSPFVWFILQELRELLQLREDAPELRLPLL